MRYSINECGIEGEWELRLDAPVRLRMGRWLLPIADRISVAARRKSILLQARFQASVTPVAFWRTKGDWLSRDAEGLPQVTAQKHRFVLLLTEALHDIEIDDGHSVSRGRGKTILPALESAIDLLRHRAPRYLSWVDRVIRNIVPLRGSRAFMRSGSTTGQPGVVQMSFRGPPAALAEMLVHEGTHQYMHLLCRLGGLDDGSDATLYYSPVRQMNRPIANILIAYHAFANVLFFYRSCSAKAPDGDDYCRRSEKALLPQLEQLDTALRATRTLTPLGRALWELLAERLH